MEIIFNELNDDGFIYQYADFYVNDVAYTISFTYAVEGSLDFDEVISRLTRGKHTYTVEFSLSEIFYDDHYQGELYSAPKNYHLTKSKYQNLKEVLFSLIFRHYQRYNPDCYFIVADRLSLQKMYRQMCNSPSEALRNFKAILGLGLNGECFLILTPNYKNYQE
ncbi:hypothetical protein BMT54_05855 [Pasteurellaceae bacterium 15-036681]|nr:hypothetical protein BMT54_05855 [Pasteurellaceae bacterium 15-036681]